jgi:hypothetical protein
MALQREEPQMQESNETSWRQVTTLIFATSLTLIAAATVARLHGAELLSYILAGMGVSLVLGFMTGLAKHRK